MPNDEQLELILQEKAKAPRVTLEAVNANIKSDEYIIRGRLTICILTLQNGYELIGTSAATSIENFDEEIGKNLAKQNAVSQIWPLMGYKLKEDLFIGSKETTFLDRLKKEYNELKKKKL